MNSASRVPAVFVKSGEDSMDCLASDPDNGHDMEEGEPTKFDEHAGNGWRSGTHLRYVHPNRDTILNLVDRAELDKFGDREEPPIPARTEVITNAMASVQLLDRLGADMVYSHGFGIDYAGRVSRPGPSEENYHDEFCGMILRVQDKLRLRELRKAIRRKIEAGALHQAVHAELNDPSLDNLNLQWILGRCSPAERELYDFILLNERVKADLGKDGSSDKWTELIEMWEATGMARDVVNAVNGMVELGRVRAMIRNDLKAVGGLLKRTLNLRDDLVASIEELSPPA